jgi:hypothetical protein
MGRVHASTKGVKPRVEGESGQSWGRGQYKICILKPFKMIFSGGSIADNLLFPFLIKLHNFNCQKAILAGPGGLIDAASWREDS